MDQGKFPPASGLSGRTTGYLTLRLTAENVSRAFGKLKDGTYENCLRGLQTGLHAACTTGLSLPQRTREPENQRTREPENPENPENPEDLPNRFNRGDVSFVETLPRGRHFKNLLD
jgi:hypothetical protein